MTCNRQIVKRYNCWKQPDPQPSTSNGWHIAGNSAMSQPMQTYPTSLWVLQNPKQLEKQDRTWYVRVMHNMESTTLVICLNAKLHPQSWIQWIYGPIPVKAMSSWLTSITVKTDDMVAWKYSQRSTPKTGPKPKYPWLCPEVQLTL
jgi:hypothetical protein